MIQNAYSIYDNKSASFGAPIITFNDDTAIREFTQACLQHDSPFAKHPNDYNLFYIGMYDKTTGEMTNERNRDLGLASAFIAKARQLHIQQEIENDETTK